GERNSLRILLGNLIDNAIRYSPERGKVDVNVRNDKSGPVLEVVDGGPGIPMEERERVFDRFYCSTASATPGSGLGLAIVKRIADQHQAALVLDEGPDGHGLRIEVRFWHSAL